MDPFDSEDEGRIVKVDKAYNKKDFIHSRDARHIRILCEFFETQSRLRGENVLCSIVFFGSARALGQRHWDREMEKTKNILSDIATSDADRAVASDRQTWLMKMQWLCKYYAVIEDLAEKLTVWADGAEARGYIEQMFRGSSATILAEGVDLKEAIWSGPAPLVVSTGGGPGLMRAANKGAAKAPNGRSMGLGITLQREHGLNRYVTPGLGFSFHYFFTRKFWMMYICTALIIAPGGLGTLDELMEALTLQQTGKFRRRIPIVLIGVDYWKSVINFDKMVDMGTIEIEDRDKLFYTDDADEAFEHIKGCIRGAATEGYTPKRKGM